MGSVLTQVFVTIAALVIVLAATLFYYAGRFLQTCREILEDY